MLHFGSNVFLASEPVIEEIKVEEGETFAKKRNDWQYEDDGSTCLLDILDTAGQEEYSCLRDQYCRDAQCFFVVFSLTSRPSFEQAQVMRDFICRVKDMDVENIPIILVGNKVDLEDAREVSTKEGNLFFFGFFLGFCFD